MTISSKNFTKGIRIKPDNTAIETKEGAVKVDSATNKVKAYLGGSERSVVTEDQAATFTNKTFDANATGNSISNIETADLASGVLNTSTTLAGASNTQVPSALAVKTYVDNSSADVQTDVNDLVTLSGVPVNSTNLGTFSGTTIPDNQNNKQAFQSLETAVETNASNISTHISNPTGAHAASAITNTPSGNLAATTVQGALNELQGDIDTINSTGLGNKVTGPASATDEALVRYDGTTGKLVQNSLATLTDAGVLAGLTGLTTSGNANFNGSANFNDTITEEVNTDTATTGSNAEVAAQTSPVVVLTNSSLSSISQIASPANGKVLTIINRTGNSVTINNDSGSTAANRILTGTKSAITLADQASIIVKYDNNNLRWMVIGGTGSGAGQDLETVFQLTGTDVNSWTTGNNATFLGAGTISGSFVANTSTPLNGTSSYQYTQAAGSLNDYFVSAAQPVAPRFRGVPVTLFFPYTYNGNSNDIEVILYDVTNAAIIPNSAFIQVTNGITIFRTNVTIPLTCQNIRVGFQTKVLNNGRIFAFDDVQLTSDGTVYASVNNITDWVSYTPTFVNLGTVSGVLGTQWRRVGDSIQIRGRVTLGTTAAAVASVSLPPGMVISSALSTQIAGTWSNNSDSTNRTRTLLISGGATVINFSAANSINPENGTGVGSSGQIVSYFSDLIPIVGFTSANTNIVTGPDTFSSDTAGFVYASSSQYTLTTLADAPVGTFITFTYASSTNTRTQTTTAPTQTTSDMNNNGFQLYTRAYTSSSTAGQPVAVAIQIGKGLKGLSMIPYKSTGKSVAGNLDYYTLNNNAAFGIALKDYNESTGVLYLDGGVNFASANPNSGFVFSDFSTQTNAYLTINASKNPALTGLNISAVAARGVSSSGQSIPNSANTIITYNAAKTFDTNGALNTTTGVFTAPEAGYYQANGQVTYASASFTASNNLVLRFFRNGAEYSSSPPLVPVTSTSQYSISHSDLVFLARGDTLDLRAFQNSGGARTLDPDVRFNFFSIAKVSVG